jgi:hypothetical protein
MNDPTESTRRVLQALINSEAAEREGLEGLHGQVWDTDQLKVDFKVLSFAAPFIVAIRKADGIKGSLVFQHSPRLYWGFAS